MSGFVVGDQVRLLGERTWRTVDGSYHTWLAGSVGVIVSQTNPWEADVLFEGGRVALPVDLGDLVNITERLPSTTRNSSVTTTLQERSRYGEFKDNAMLAQTLKTDLRAFPGWAKMSPHQRQALDVIMDKVSRIVCGDPNYRGNWHDIQGYAQLVEERLPGTGVPAGAAP